MISALKKLVPKPAKSIYHLILAVLANTIYRSPSDRMIVIGVTGTSGKSTVVHLIARLLEGAGYKVGAASTVFFKVDKSEKINDKKMTMIGRFALQKLIRQMSNANCQYAIIETTSEGIVQHRHHGINYDVVVFTNLYPEHIESHGSFENYKKTKLKLFTGLKNLKPKSIAGQRIDKQIVVNIDDQNSQDFFNVLADKKTIFTTKNFSAPGATIIRAEQIEVSANGIVFSVDNTPFILRLLGDHNVYNALAAIAVARSQEISLSVAAKILKEITSIPGRLEFIDQGQPFQIIVDYAFEPQAVEKLYQVVKRLKPKKIIHVLGSTGGGRDKSRRVKLGQLAGTNANFVIVTNEDPYDEDPKKIINEVSAGAQEVGKVHDQDLFLITDRRKAIAKALSLAVAGDTVLITGKGSEQAIVVASNKKIPWDDREVVREELEKMPKV